MALEKFDKMKQEQGTYLANLRAQIAEMDYLTMVDDEKEKAEARGMARGMAKGLSKGKTEGKAEVAVEMLQEGYTVSSISKMTGLSKTKISRLKNGK